MKQPRVFLLCFVLGVWPLSASDLLEAVRLAPSIVALERRVEATDARREAAGRLPDAELELTAAQIRRSMGGRDPVWEIGVTQPLSRAGERAADRARALAMSELARAELAMRMGELAAQSAAFLAEAKAADARVARGEEQAARLEALKAAVEGRLGAGAAVLAERLALETALAAVRLKIEAQQVIAADARTELRSLLGQASDAVPPAFVALDLAQTDLESSAVVALAAARAKEAGAMARMALVSGRPMTAVGLRFEREREAMGDMDRVGLVFRTDLPFRARGIAAAEARAARAEEAAARSEAAAGVQRARAALARAERAERIAASVRAYAEAAIARLRAEFETLTRAPTPDLVRAVGLLDQETEISIQIIDTELAAESARAELWKFAPVELLLAR